MNPWKQHISIRFKLIAAFSTMIVPIVLLGFISQRLMYHAIEDRVILSTTTTVDLSAKLMEKILASIKDDYIRILSSSEIQDYYNFENKKSEENSIIRKNFLKKRANNYLTNRAFSSTLISHIWILTNELCSSLGITEYPIYYDRDRIVSSMWYKSSFDGDSRLTFYGFHPGLNKRRKGKQYSYALALTGCVKKIANGSFINRSIGVMIIDLDEDYINKVLAEIKLGRGGEIHVITPDGRDITPSGKVLRKNSRLRALLADICADETVSGNRSILYKGRKYLIMYHKIKGTKLLIAGLQPEYEIIAAARHINMITVFLVLLALGTAIILGIILTIGIGGRIARFSEVMGKVAGGNFEVTMPIVGNDEITLLGKGFNKMVEELNWYIAKSIENEKIKREMAIHLLISQINPHVIYNTLNSVIYLAKQNKNKDIIKMVESFINLLHNSIKIGDSGLFATVKEEIDSIKNYAVIQHYRYPGKFSMEWDVDDTLLDFKLPRTIIQPLVENALFHGICPLEGTGIIRVTVKRHDPFIKISVTDTGKGMNLEEKEDIFQVKRDAVSNGAVKSIGLLNIKERIEYFYGDKGSVEVYSSQDHGTRVEILIPLNSDTVI